jgi:SAM-dependent methyltransferase
VVTAESIVEQVERELVALGLCDEYFAMRRRGYQADLERLEVNDARSPLLELGGYPFHFSRCLMRAKYEATSIDLDPERARPWLDTHAIPAVRCDIERDPLPQPDASIAPVVLAETFEHLRIDPLFTLREISRVLRPDGLLYLTTPNFYRLGNVARFLLGRGLSNDPLYEYESSTASATWATCASTRRASSRHF